MRKYISISLTNYGHDHAHLNRAYIYFSFTEGQERHNHWRELSYTDGMRLFQKLAKKAGRMPSWQCNEFSTSIANREISLIL